MKKLAEIIQDLRSVGLTQDEVGEVLGLSQAYISGIEAGKRGGRTPADTLERAVSAREKYCGKREK